MDLSVFETKTVGNISRYAIHSYHIIKSKIEEFTKLTDFDCKLEKSTKGNTIFTLHFTLNFDTEVGALKVEYIFEKQLKFNWILKRSKLSFYPKTQDTGYERVDFIILRQESCLNRVNDEIISFIEEEIIKQTKENI